MNTDTLLQLIIEFCKERAIHVPPVDMDEFARMNIVVSHINKMRSEITDKYASEYDGNLSQLLDLHFTTVAEAMFR